jgi:hypothetical protein
MEEGGGSRLARVMVEDVGSSSELSLSTASNASIKDPKTTDPERRKARKERGEAKTARREEREKKKKLEEKLQQKEARRIKREERVKRRTAREKMKSKELDASPSELSSSSDDGDDDISYQASKNGKNQDEGSTNKKKYVVVSFNYSSYLTNRDRKSFINVPAGKLPHFDGTNFAKWKHLMKAYLISIHPGLWEIVRSGFQLPKDPKKPTNDELAAVHLNGQATSILLSTLDGNEYIRVMNVEVAKQIWDTLHLAHEGVDKVRMAKIDLLLAKLNGFVIANGEGPQEMFDRLMTLVGEIRGYGCDELDDHKVVKIMLEAYSPRNETVVTLIRDKKKFEHFTPNDVLGRLLTFDMQRVEANERRKLGELQAKLDGMKIKDIALKANKTSKQSTHTTQRAASNHQQVNPRKRRKSNKTLIQHHPQVKMRMKGLISRK